jgi:copper transport protein
VRALATAALAASLLLVTAAPASAHAYLVSSDPSSGAVLATAPQTARLWFSEEVDPAHSSVTLLERDGDEVGRAIATADPSDPSVLEVRLPRLRAETYGLAWDVLASDDGHRTSGVVVFSVGAAAAQSISDDGGGADEVALVLRWLGLLSMAIAVGGLAIGIAVGGVGRRDGVVGPDVCARLLAASAGAAALALSLSVGSWWRVVGHALPELGTRDGAMWWLRAGGLVAIGVVAWRSRTRGRLSWPGAAATGVAAAAVAVAESVTSHASVGPVPRWPEVLAEAGHALAAFVWLGALPAIAVLAWPLWSSQREVRSAVLRAARGRISFTLAASVGVLLGTGLVRAADELRSISDLWDTAYGRALAVKTVLFTSMAVLGAVNASRLHGRSVRALSRRAPAGQVRIARGLVLVEAVLGVAALVAATVMTGSASPRLVAPSASAATDEPHTAAVADLVVTATATPDAPGVNWVTVVAASSRRPPPASVTSIDLVVGDGTTTPLRPMSDDTFYGVARLPASTRVDVTVVVSRGGEQLPVTLRWALADSAVSDASPAGALAPLGLAVLAVVLGSGVRRLRRHANGASRADIGQEVSAAAAQLEGAGVAAGRAAEGQPASRGS